MRRESPAVKVRCVHLILLIGVLASLCFSVGEGMRLLPLPHLPTLPGESADARPRLSTQSVCRLNQFQAGSITQPPQAQKTLKRKQAQWAPASPCDLPLPHSLRYLSGAERRTGFYPAESTSRQAGRAPPRTT
jgi:hypothetical protein